MSRQKQKEERGHFTWKQKGAALARQLVPYRASLIVLATLEVFIAAGNGVIPYITGKFFDGLIAPGILVLPGIGVWPVWAAVLTLWALVQALTNSLQWVIDARTSRLTSELEGGIQARAYARLLTLPVSFLKKHRAGEITNTIDRSGWMLTAIVNSMLTVAPQLLTVAIGVAISFAIRTELALILLAGMALYLLVLARVLPSTAARQEEAHKIWNRAYGDAADAYANVYTVKQAGAEAYERERILNGFFGRAIPLWYRAERVWNTLSAAQRVVITVTQGVILFYSAFLVLKGAITIGDLIAFNAYAGMIVGPFVSLGRQWQNVQNGLITLARGEQVFGTPSEIYEPEHAESLGTLRGDVGFKGVHFSYEKNGREVLKGISFEARAGQAVALVGETGVGKSTTIELLSGYYFPTEGRVEIDGHDIRRISLRELRAQIAVVPQEVVLFNASIADNIRYGRPDASDEEVRRAALRAHADTFIENFPERYAQEVGERGIKLSVGQKQRVAIARAILRDPRILILDEPTSALDPETEHYISQALEELMRGRTTFIVAHRLSTVRKANLILVLKDGEVAERGTHDELAALSGGIYRRLYELHIGLHD